jgi:predicted transcriptional regulator
VELRKTKPKLETPFKCYIYCTKGNVDMVPSKIWWKADSTGFQHIMNGKVIGEFVCDGFLSHCEMANADIAEQTALVRREKILEYSNGKEVFGWHISELKLYDKPKELSEFLVEDNRTFDCPQLVAMKRAPQSWCYVEGVCDNDRA